MKKIIAIAFALIMSISLFGQEVDNKKKIDKMLELGFFKIEITKIRPMSLPSRTTRMEFDITMKDHMLTTELPYMGKLDVAPMPGQEIRVEMENQKVDIQIKYNEKREKHEVRFRAKDDNSHNSVDFYIEIFNNGNCKRDFTYVDDIVEGIVRIMQHAPQKENGEDGLPIPPYKVYNIGNNSPENLLDFVEILQQELLAAGVLPEDYDFEAHKELVAMQPGDVPITYADTTAFEQAFRFKPHTSLRDGLRKFAVWYKEFYTPAAEK